MIALSNHCDPYNADTPARSAAARWIGDIWSTVLGRQHGLHIRRIHYRLVSQTEPLVRSDNVVFENTYDCWTWLIDAVRDARYLGLIPLDAIIDNRNPDPLIFAEATALTNAGVALDPGWVGHTFRVEDDQLKTSLVLPSFSIIRPVVPQPYLVEIWTEKSTISDVLEPLGQQYGVNIAIFAGEASATGCTNLVERVRACGKPCRILYVSDFDPGGQSMPLAAARKIEYLVQDQGLDIRLRNVALTHDQCVAYRLPRTPIKETERRAAAFEKRFGEGGTELDALEALHPGALARILEAEIGRYYDATLEDRIDEAVSEAEAEIEAFEDDIRERYADEIEAIESDVDALNEEISEFVERVREREQDIAERAAPLIRRIERDHMEIKPEAGAFDWPEAEEGDEDEDPLYDSTRSYIGQIDRYREHQGKGDASYPQMLCARKGCGKTFRQKHPNTRYCSAACQETVRRLERKEARASSRE
jgi:hypothetical protein